MKRSGFTTIELAIVIVIMGVIAAMGFPKIRRMMDQTNVRSARLTTATLVATARAAAIQRGCVAAVRFNSSAATVWVTTTCAGKVDTVSSVQNLRDRFHVTMTAALDSVRFDPRGLPVEVLSGNTTLARYAGSATSRRDSTVISQMGKVMH